MKKLTLILLVLFTFSLTGCTSTIKYIPKVKNAKTIITKGLNTVNDIKELNEIKKGITNKIFKK